MEKQIEELISDRQKFNEFVYTSIDEATKEVEARASDQKLTQSVIGALPDGYPTALNGQRNAVLFRHIATPNYEFRRFLSLVDVLDKYSPVIFEYHEDKFVDKNENKYYLGMVPFFAGRGKKGGEKINLLKVIDFNLYRGKKFSEIFTLWGESLVDFHHTILNLAYEGKGKPIHIEDMSTWFHDNGNGAAYYYKNFLTLFLQNNILFENFMLDSKELGFTKEVFLPAFIKIFNETGHKPLIVALEPTEVESELFWHCHPSESQPFVDSKLKLNVATAV